MKAQEALEAAETEHERLRLDAELYSSNVPQYVGESGPGMRMGRGSDGLTLTQNSYTGRQELPQSPLQFDAPENAEVYLDRMGDVLVRKTGKELEKA